jgi:HMG (high mobility group) box
MSAFLKYSQKRRQEVKEANPEMNNTDISRLLGELWRAADAVEKEPFVESEKVERAMYNEAIATWREEQAHLDAASRTSHHSVQHSVLVDQSLADAPPIRKKRRETIQQSLSDSSQATAPPFASVDGRVIDRRIFRSYSGSSHPHENKPYAYDPRNYNPTYYLSDTARSHNTKGEQTSYYHNKPAADARSYKVEPISTSTSGGMSTIQPVEYPTRYHPNQYRPQYPTPQGENRHAMPLPNTGSDLFDNGFHDPDPPFNPRQTRPSSHYNGYFFP